jgi:hypothetical protein
MEQIAHLLSGITSLFVRSGLHGLGDMFAPKHAVSGDYLLMQGKSENMEVYLMVKGQSVSVAGPLHDLGWNDQYIIFTDANWPQPWNVIRVKDHAKFTITDAQRTTNPIFKGIAILSPADAWNGKSH